MSMKMPIFTATSLVSKADGIAASLVLQCQQKQSNGREITGVYCFNLPESLPRLATTHGIDLRQTLAFFVPAVSFDSLGGFPSAFLNSARRHATISPTFIGPEGLEAVKWHYAQLSSVMEKADCRPLRSRQVPYYMDDCVRVYGISPEATPATAPPWLLTLTDDVIDLLSASETGESTDVRHDPEVIDLVTDEDEMETDLIQCKVCLKPTTPGRKRQKRERNVLVVSMKRPKKRCRFDANATKHRLNRVWCFAVLLRATDEIIVVVFLPDLYALEDLLRNPLSRCLVKSVKPIKAIFHLSSPELMSTEEYKKWMGELSGEQIVVDGTKGEGKGLDIGLTKVTDRGFYLRAAARAYFPLPSSFSTDPEPNGIVFQNGEIPQGTRVAHLLSKIEYGETRAPLTPKTSPIEAMYPKTLIAERLKSNTRLRDIVSQNDERGLNVDNPWELFLPLLTNKGLPAIGRELREQGVRLDAVLDQMKLLVNAGQAPPYLLSMAEQKDQSSILFLGTGCAEPSEWRGGSAILIRIGNRQRGILLDCGEGTYGQMIRYLGVTGAQRAVDGIHCIWISHRHIDHCAGLATLLERRSPNLPKVSIYAPKQVQSFLGVASERCTVYGNRQMEQHKNLMVLLGIASWRSVLVSHSVEAYGVRIDLANGFSLVYSGDTEPCTNLMELGYGCTLLIHESTHSCRDIDAARRTKHSTWGQALQASMRMNAYRTILTHFSRRYPGMPDGLTADELGTRAAVAFDGMLVKMTDIYFLPSFNSAIQNALMLIEFGGNLVSSDDDDPINLVSESSHGDRTSDMSE